MVKNLPYKTVLLIYGIPLSILIFSIFLLKSGLFNQHPNLITGITYDLTLTVPFIYFLLIRKKDIPKITVVPFFVIGVVLASIFIPAENTYHLNMVKTFILPLVELTVVSLIIYKVSKLIKVFKKEENKSLDFYSTLKQSAFEITKSNLFSSVFAMEIGMIYYAIFKWKKPVLNENEFTSYKESDSVIFYISILLVILVETVGIHFLFIKWNAIFAWIMFGLSMYTFLQLGGQAKAIMHRVHTIKDNSILLTYGVFSQIEFSIKDIENIVYSKKEDENGEKLALVKEQEDHNVIFYLKQNYTLEKVYGITKETKIIACQIDDLPRFKEQIESKLNG